MPEFKPKKIVFVNTLYAPHEKGGAERSVKAIAEQHVISGGQSVVITLSPEKKLSSDVINGVKIYYVPVFNATQYLFGGDHRLFKKIVWKLMDLYNPVMAWRVYKILKIEKPDMVETNNLQGFSVSVWKAAKFLQIPITQVLRDYYLGCNNSCMYKNNTVCEKQCSMCKIVSYGKKMASSDVDEVCGVSQKMLESFNAMGYFPNKIKEKTVYSAVYSSNGENRDGGPLSKTSSVLRIGFIGRHENIKGIETLLKAAKSLSQKSYNFLIAGGGDDKYSQILCENYKQKNIIFMGHQTPDNFYPQIDILVVPSLWKEPFGRIIAESYTYGIPVIVSDRGGMPEVVEKGVTGLVFKAGDVQSLIEALEFARITNSFADKEYLKNYSHTFSSHNVYLRHLEAWNASWRDAS